MRGQFKQLSRVTPNNPKKNRTDIKLDNDI